MYFRLPLLPLNNIDEGIKAIKEEQKRLGVAKDFNKKFVKYFSETWIKRYPKSLWCVSGAINRTNNICESYNAAIKRFMMPRPHPYSFFEGMITMAHDALAKLLTSKPKAPRSKLNSMVELLMPQLESGEITVKECLIEMATMTGPCEEDESEVEED